MKIAFITHQFPPSIGGMQQWNHQMARAYGKAGHSVDVFHLKHGTRPHSDPEYRYIGIPMVPGARVESCETSRYTVGFLLRLVQFLISFIPKLSRYDAWQLTFGEPALLRIFFVLASQITGTKLIMVSGCVIFRHPYTNRFRRCILFSFARLSLKRAAVILVDGKDIADEITAQGVPADRIRICYAGIDTNLFKPGGDKRRLLDFARYTGRTFDPHVPIILYSARFSYENAPITFLAALEQMHDVQAIMIGDGILMPEVREKSASLKIPVHLWGSLDYHELPLVYGAVDLCLYPYSRFIGGISQVIPLSMSCGACVITTTIGDNNALIESGKNGFLVPEGDTTAMCGHMHRLFDDPHSIQTIRSAARTTITEHWQLAVRDAMYADLISKLQS